MFKRTGVAKRRRAEGAAVTATCYQRCHLPADITYARKARRRGIAVFRAKPGSSFGAGRLSRSDPAGKVGVVAGNAAKVERCFADVEKDGRTAKHNTETSHVASADGGNKTKPCAQHVASAVAQPHTETSRIYRRRRFAMAQTRTKPTTAPRRSKCVSSVRSRTSVERCRSGNAPGRPGRQKTQPASARRASHIQPRAYGSALAARAVL
jgi:hypothetical protein